MVIRASDIPREVPIRYLTDGYVVAFPSDMDNHGYVPFGYQTEADVQDRETVL